MPYQDMAIVCGLSGDDANGDWEHFGLPVQEGDIWEFAFLCCHKLGPPDAEVMGSFVIYDGNGVYRSTAPDPTTTSPPAPLIDSTQWQRYTYQHRFTGHLYVFPAIWWHGPGELESRYVAAVQMARILGGATVQVAQPDVFLTLREPPA